MPLVSITRLRVRSLRFLPEFIWYSLRSARQASKSPGNFATRILKERHWAFWTTTSWTDEAAMKNFMLADPHRAAMRKLLEWCDEAALVHWLQDTRDLPDWKEAHRRLQADGRRSKVNHPSANQVAYQIPDPRAGRGAFRLK
jgi:heme-degrading monooxygenase HmoA